VRAALPPLRAARPAAIDFVLDAYAALTVQLDRLLRGVDRQRQPPS
jgi:hypothetical protein